MFWQVWHFSERHVRTSNAFPRVKWLIMAPCSVLLLFRLWSRYGRWSKYVCVSNLFLFVSLNYVLVCCPWPNGAKMSAQNCSQRTYKVTSGQKSENWHLVSAKSVKNRNTIISHIWPPSEFASERFARQKFSDSGWSGFNSRRRLMWLLMRRTVYRGSVSILSSKKKNLWTWPNTVLEISRF